VLNLSPGDRFWAGDWGGGVVEMLGHGAWGLSGGWGGEWREKGVGERECLAGSRVEWGMEGSGERVDVADRVTDW
jgi:hypothetical protein